MSRFAVREREMTQLFVQKIVVTHTGISEVSQDDHFTDTQDLAYQ